MGLFKVYGFKKRGRTLKSRNSRRRLVSVALQRHILGREGSCSRTLHPIWHSPLDWRSVGELRGGLAAWWSGLQLSTSVLVPYKGQTPPRRTTGSLCTPAQCKPRRPHAPIDALGTWDKDMQGASPQHLTILKVFSSEFAR